MFFMFFFTWTLGWVWVGREQQIVLVPPRITLLSTRKSTFRDEKKPSLFPFSWRQSYNILFYIQLSIFRFNGSLRLSLSPSLFCLCSIQQSDLSLINQAFFLFSRSFSGLERWLGRAWCLGCIEWMQLQKKKQDQTNFFEIHLTMLHIFYVLFHLDTWMGLGETRTQII